MVGRAVGTRAPKPKSQPHLNTNMIASKYIGFGSTLPFSAFSQKQMKIIITPT